MPSLEAWSVERKSDLWEARNKRNSHALELSLRHEKQVMKDRWCLWAIPLVLNLGGLVMIASLLSRSNPADGATFYWLVLRQLQFLCLGLALMYICCLMPLSQLRRLGGLLWFVAVVMTFLTLFPSLGVRAGGARRWLNVLGFQFQPLELLTLSIPIFLADRLAVCKRENLECFLRPTLLVVAISTAPLFLQPSMGGIVLVTAICVSMHVVNRGWKYPLLGSVFLIGLFIVLIYSADYRMRRFSAFMDPWDDPMGRGFQIIQGLIAFSNGGIMGVGVGKGLQRMSYLPAAHTDFIFPAIGEEFGLVGTLFIVLLYAFWTFKAYTLYRRSNDPFISALIWGITASVLFPMFINLGGVMKLIPLTGIPLPFISFGGTALVCMWIRVGILMRIAKELDDRQ